MFKRIPNNVLRLNLFKNFVNKFSTNKPSSQQFNELFTNEFDVDIEFFQNVKNQQRILDNIRDREMIDNFPELFADNLDSKQLGNRLIEISRTLPNDFHPIWNDRQHQTTIIDHIGQQQNFDFKPLKAEDLLFEMNLAQFSSITRGKLGIVGGPRSYMFIEQLAELSRALARWTMAELINKHGFTPVVTPNLIYSDFVRACGFEPFGERTQVYTMDGRRNVCLAGTAEMPLASMNLGENFATENDLPKLYCALSRCYRAEAKSSGEMSGLYRVHYFDKVEMFALTEPNDSDRMLDKFVSIEKSLFEQLGLYFRIVDMPPNELGPAAYRKFDIETYMYGRDFWGEISSASNCTDYQSKRLNITYQKFYFDSKTKAITEVRKNYVHTVNGTACAIPRIIIAIVEQNQSKKQDYFIIPECLRPFMKNDRIKMIKMNS
ncbi:seryl-tRNA synthetase [Dermatophagoides pteronyssinus]|uniref:serine--tRNA ligase n=1 Tax=Dermatophagoides pteronyssinus TaxID=6956 RepID=A0ABQ8J706_DERPT|nr:seryl-tRNA synthetase [Dermatophagoides pteronyssinus]